MVRIWGGGQFEPDAFYDLCDELGLLVWHDLMFACARYPDDDKSFVKEIAEEVRYQVKRLRHHPSIVLWCGSNEIDWQEEMFVGMPAEGRPYPGSTVIHEVARSIVKELDPDTPWWPSSPMGGNDHNSEEQGDRHNWSTWHGLAERRQATVGVAIEERLWIQPNIWITPAAVSYRHLEHDRSSFLSEFGSHSVPVVATMRKYLGAEMLAHDSPAIRFRDRNGSVGRLDTFMAAHTGVPPDFARYVALSQWVQAETVRTGIETSRRRMWECSGVLFWQWNDCWPGITWSVVDVDGRLKAAYFAAKRAWQPRILAIADEDSRYAVHVINDTETAWSDVVFWKLLRFDGQVISEGEGDFSVRPRAASLALVVPAPLESLRQRLF